MICDNIQLRLHCTCGSTEMSTQAVSGLSLLGMRSTFYQFGGKLHKMAGEGCSLISSLF